MRVNPMRNKTPDERRAIAAKSHATRKANKEALEKARQEAIIYADGLREEIDALEKRLSTMEKMEAMTLASAAISGKAMLREDEIAKESLPWNKASGIYFLLQGDEVVYVGQSVNIYSRISQHTDKQFDRYAFLPCDSESMDKIESLYIHCLRPRLNGNMANGSKSAPIMLDKLIM